MEQLGHGPSTTSLESKHSKEGSKSVTIGTSEGSIGIDDLIYKEEDHAFHGLKKQSARRWDKEDRKAEEQRIEQIKKEHGFTIKGKLA
jgi:hypothetical protein